MNVFRFGPFQLDPAQGLLSSAGGDIALTPKAFDTLRVLVESAGTVISKQDLLDRVWPDAHVDENNLAQSISLVRKALAAADPTTEYVQTLPRRGYRFVVPVTRDGGSSGSSGSSEFLGSGGTTAHELPPRNPEEPRNRGTESIRYARSGNVNIAYQVVGDGPIDVVFVMGWVSHLEMFWQEPSFARFLRRIAGFSRLILFDKRGTGLSDSVPVSQLPTLEERMDDVRAVMHAAGSTRAVVMGVSEGGTMSSLFAATYPEHTAGVIIIGGYARRMRADDYPWGPTPEQREAFIEYLEREWGGPVGIEERAPSMAGDPEFRKWWSSYLRMGASPGAAAALTRMNADIDIRNVLPTLRVPALVIHRTGDRCLLVQEGRYMAERIPGARFVELPGNDHLPFVGDQDAVLDEIERFVSGLGATPDRSRVLATLLFLRTDVDEQHRLFDEVDDDASREIGWFQGNKIGRIHDALVATFDGPARAIRCARALLDAAAARGVRLAAGLHTGECELTPAGIAGASVEIGALLAEAAQVGEIVVSNTVRDLVAGSGLQFDPRGQAELGRLGDWKLFTVRR
ncbi:MAG TPA: alpha/beta fold hydrolase [Thermoanaerobaculia bacterium]|jgi:pimeloyl-ACP methyl ester carboxylesterase/DNA-binding winged helix-turn-helix (wHTH) protein